MWPFSQNANERKASLEAEFATLQPRMFAAQIVQCSEELSVLLCVRMILHNDEGRLGLQIAQAYRSQAIHEINQDGSFSKKGPSWTKKPWSSNPLRWALCQMVISNSPAGFKNPREEIRSYGLRVVEMDTSRLPEMSFSEWRLFTGK